MTARRNKKVRKQRGFRTYGWGHPKKHRGSGSRGGVGKAGRGKKGSHKKTLYYNLGYGYVGWKSGFTNPTGSSSVKTINLKEIENNLHNYVEKKIAKETKGIIELDVSQLGCQKVLGSGNLKTKMKITAKSFSSGAAEKIKAAGGETVVA